ncbi:TPA: hypothetical protein QCI34_004508 [Enterobacter roggenkampii]|nr:hypothetical protein [Enterobacter roggenkampii]
MLQPKIGKMAIVLALLFFTHKHIKTAKDMSVALKEVITRDDKTGSFSIKK